MAWHTLGNKPLPRKRIHGALWHHQATIHWGILLFHIRHMFDVVLLTSTNWNKCVNNTLTAMWWSSQTLILVVLVPYVPQQWNPYILFHILSTILWKRSSANDDKTTSLLISNIGSGNALVSSDNRPLLELKLVWYHMVSQDHNELSSSGVKLTMQTKILGLPDCFAEITEWMFYVMAWPHRSLYEVGMSTAENPLISKVEI